ncbi:MAG: hypothetical protein ABUS79_25875 [Pseudomonadota bacterium]
MTRLAVLNFRGGVAFAVAAAAVTSVTGCGNVDDRPAEWAFISPAIFQPSCATASCHSPATSASGLDFSTADNGYSSLTRLWIAVVSPPDAGVAAGTSCQIQSGTQVCIQRSRPLVTPYDPQGSRVVNMLRARNAPRMPPDRPLPEAEIRLVERWILNGACQSGRSCAGAATDGGTSTDAGGDRAATVDSGGDQRPGN